MQCRGAKETMLGSNPPKEYRLSVPGSGARLIESTKSVVLDQSEVKRLLVDGFFGRVDLHERPLATESGSKSSGFLTLRTRTSFDI